MTEWGEAPCQPVQHWFFDQKYQRRAKMLCQGCELKDRCAALRTQEAGVWGGKRFGVPRRAS